MIWLQFLPCFDTITTKNFIFDCCALSEDEAVSILMKRDNDDDDDDDADDDDDNDDGNLENIAHDGPGHPVVHVNLGKQDLVMRSLTNIL